MGGSLNQAETEPRRREQTEICSAERGLPAKHSTGARAGEPRAKKLRQMRMTSSCRSMRVRIREAALRSPPRWGRAPRTPTDGGMGHTWGSGQEPPEGGGRIEERANDPRALSARSKIPRMRAAKESREVGTDPEKLRGAAERAEGEGAPGEGTPAPCGVETSLLEGGETLTPARHPRRPLRCGCGWGAAASWDWARLRRSAAGVKRPGVRVSDPRPGLTCP